MNGIDNKARWDDNKSPSLNSDPRDMGCGGRPWVGGDPMGLEVLGLPSHSCLLEVHLQRVRSLAWGWGQCGAGRGHGPCSPERRV